ncbi:hypothetical protein C5167_028876 [Papaver somniferum]|nr:hypothetical protein C5167_028876 [Papaver somniferum]
MPSYFTCCRIINETTVDSRWLADDNGCRPFTSVTSYLGANKDGEDFAYQQ